MVEMNPLLGRVGIVGIWLTAGLALPFVNYLDVFAPTQLMVFRGFLTAAMAFIGLRGRIGKVDGWTWGIAVVLPLATLGLFEGIRHWGAGPTIIVITATPLVNMVVDLALGRHISRASVGGLCLLLVGIGAARWGGSFRWDGFLWSVFGTVANGVLYECFARAKSDWLQRCFLSCTGMGTLGLVMSIGEPWPTCSWKLSLVIVGFAFVGGYLYWWANYIAFKNLPTTKAAVGAQGETPAVVI